VKERISYANVMATVAVFIAMGGGAYAVKNSVGSKEIENGTVRSKELKDDDVRAEDIETAAVGGSEVADGSVGSADIAGSAVGAAQIGTDAVKAAEIAANAVGTSEIAANAVGAAKIADGAVGAGEIADGQVGAAEIADSAVTGADVAADSLAGADIDEASLNGAQVTAAGLLSAHVDDLGGAATTRYGAVSGVSTASATMEDVQSAMPSPFYVGDLWIWVPADLAAGQSRKFTLVYRPSPTGAILDSTLTCTISAGQDHCNVDGPVAFGALMVAIKVESTGAGLSATDEAYIGMAGKGLMP
jgi:hypothetical protein